MLPHDSPPALYALIAPFRLQIVDLAGGSLHWQAFLPDELLCPELCLTLYYRVVTTSPG